MNLVERDYEIFRAIDRWRFCLGRQIKILAGFAGERACDRRLRALIEAKYLERRKIIYGVPGLYSLTYKAKMLIGANKRQEKIRLEHIVHDIAVIDTAICLANKTGISFQDITTEKQMHSENGFNVRSHYPDFTFIKDGKTTCVEVELTLKSKERLEKNIRNNFLTYDTQIWVVGSNQKITAFLNSYKTEYPNIEIISMEGVKTYVHEFTLSQQPE